MRHTWHADQETTVLLHFCHHLPTDFSRIPIWTGRTWLSLQKFSINSFTAEGAIGPFPPAAINYLVERRVLTPRKAAASALKSGAHGLCCGEPVSLHLSTRSARPPAKQPIVRIPRPGNDEHGVKSAAQITNFNSLQSLLLICVLWGEALVEGYVTACVGQMKGALCLLCEQQQAGLSPSQAGEAWALQAPPTTMH